jgi:peptide/nickel transport system substrate-binding protein
VTTYQPDTAIEVEFRDDWALGDLEWMEDVEGMKRGGPFLDSIRFKVYTSETAMNQAFLQGELDTLYGPARAANVPQIKETEGMEIVEGGDTGYSYFGYNLRRVPFDDAPFRQALSMLWDDIYWVNRLAQGYAHEGDFVVPPGFTAARPDNGEGLTDPATQAFTFRASTPGVPNYSAIRSFLTDGKMVTGESGTFAGQDYPGSLTGASTSQSSPRHDYSFGEVTSSILQDFGADQEIRVDGKTITEIKGEPLTYYMYPPQLVPNLTEMDKIYVQNLKQLGIPIEQKVLAFNPLLQKVYAEEDFDMYHMGWGNTSPFGISSMYSIFHSDNADDHSIVEEGHDSKNVSTLLNNSTGYGIFDYASADDLISEARQTMETEPRNELAREAVERIYLDQPYQVYQYEIKQWPIRSDKYTGYVGGIPGPGMTNLSWQIKYTTSQK